MFHVFAAEPNRQRLYGSMAARTGWDVSLVVADNWRNDYSKAIPVRRWPTFHGGLSALPVGLPGNIPLHFFAGRVANLIRREKPDMIYVYHEAYAVSTFQVFLANQRSLRVPIGFYSSQNLTKKYPVPFSAMERWVYKQADFAVAVSPSVAEVLRAKGFTGRLEVVPFEVDTDRFASVNGQAALSLTRPDLSIGYFGRLVSEKGIDTLLEALALVRTRARVRAAIVGNGKDSGNLKALAAQLGVHDIVEWKKPVAHADLASIYRTLDVLILPSRSTPRWKEQFGRVVLEANASGVPVITSDSGELPTVVAATGGGWTFPENSAQALADKLLYASSHREELARRGSDGQSAVRRQFSIDSVASKLASAIAGGAS